MLLFCSLMMQNQQDYETVLEFLFDVWGFFVCFVFFVFCFAFGPPICKASMKSSNRVWIMEMNSKKRMKLKQLSNCFIVSLGILWKYPRNLAISSNNFLFIFFLKILPNADQKFDESY